MNSNDINKLLNHLHQKHLACSEGSTANYIPELAKANKDHFALSVVTVDGQTFEVGNFEQPFTLQSISKPFVYGLALELRGKEKILSKVGVEPTGEAFNSIIELEKSSHRPYNPMINSGAIAICSLIDGKNIDTRLKKVMNLFERLSGKPLEIDEQVFLSEKSTAHRNRAITHLLANFDIIEEKSERSIEELLDLYFKQCSILVDTRNLAQMAATLANGGVQPLTSERIYSTDFNRDILSLMFTCGMYDTAGDWAYSVGVPAKSGVSGGLIAVVPGKLGIAAYSPLIDHHGHSIKAERAIKEFAKTLSLSIFS